MKCISKIALLLVGSSLLFTGCSLGNKAPNGSIEYAHVSLNIDETNMNVYAGAADYIFIGEVTEVDNTKLSKNLEHSTYSIKVIEDLKGELESNIKVSKFGGYKKDGTLLLYQSDKIRDTGLPIKGEKYVFMAYGQPNGSLKLTEFYGNVFYEGEETKKEYLGYIDKQTENNRDRFISIYDKNYDKNK